MSVPFTMILHIFHKNHQLVNCLPQLQNNIMQKLNHAVFVEMMIVVGLLSSD